MLQSLFIELWSNEDRNAFAIKLSSDQENCFRAIMQQHNNGKFTEIADVMYYDESSHYDWPFMLEKWIEAWKSGFRHSSSIPEFQRLYTDKSKASAEQKSCDSTTATIMIEDIDTSTKRKLKNNNNSHKKPSLKCHYCNLMFYGTTERSAHEKTWHADKLLKSHSNNNSLKLGGDDASSRKVRNNGR